RYWRRKPWLRVKTELLFAAQAVGVFARLMTSVPEAHLRRAYRRRLWNFLRHRRDPGLCLNYVIHIAMHYHAYTLATQMRSGRTGVVNSYGRATPTIPLPGDDRMSRLRPRGAGAGAGEPPAPGPVQALIDLQLLLGNPSGAQADPRDES